MSSSPDVHRVDPHAFDPDLLDAVVDEATKEDGAEPLNEAAQLALRRHGLEGSTLFTVDADGFAWVHGGEIDLVVKPDARGRGLGTALVDAVTASHPGTSLSAWSHGDHPAAAVLAERFGFRRVRDLWVMRRPLGGDAVLPPRKDITDVVFRSFRPGADEDDLLALNAEAFVEHPEQGALTRADLDQRMAEPWFDPEGLFVAEPAPSPLRAGDGESAPSGAASGNLLGFHWTKVHDTDPPIGEVYVVGVSPRAQGMGVGRLLTLAGLHHLADLGLGEVHLYVESDNRPAIRVYSRLGFTHAPADTHVMYRRG